MNETAQKYIDWPSLLTCKSTEESHEDISHYFPKGPVFNCSSR